MTNTAGNTFIWNQNQTQTRELPPLPQLSNPHDVAERLFAELGLDRFLADNAAGAPPSEKPAGKAADAPAEKAPAQAGEPAPDASADQKGASARLPAPFLMPTPSLFALVPRPGADEATPDAIADDEGYFIEVPFVTDEAFEQDGTFEEGVWMADSSQDGAGASAEDSAEDSWLGVDPSSPREWTAEDLMLLIYRDRSQVSEAAAQLVDLPAYEAYDEADQGGAQDDALDYAQEYADVA